MPPEVRRRNQRGEPLCREQKPDLILMARARWRNDERPLRVRSRFQTGGSVRGKIAIPTAQVMSVNPGCRPSLTLPRAKSELAQRPRQASQPLVDEIK